MKNYFGLLAAGALLLGGCNELDEVISQVEEENPAIVEANLEITIEDAFSTIDEANEGIPAYLNATYPYLEGNSAAIVTFGLDIYPSIEEQYTLEFEDYNSNFGNFSSTGAIVEFLNTRYPNFAEGQAVELEYEYWTGSFVDDRNEAWIFFNGEWNRGIEIENDMYDFVGNGRFDNFTDLNEAGEDLTTIMNSFANPNWSNADEGDFYYVGFEYTYVDDNDDRQFLKLVTPAVYTNGKWVVRTDEIAIPITLQYGYRNGSWEPDNTVKYTLGGADYGTVAGYADSNPGGIFTQEEIDGPFNNLGRFGNFDRRSSSSNYWSNDLLQRVMNLFLSDTFPGAVADQAFIITVSTYIGTNADESLTFVYDGTMFVLQ